ncbi:hypothetical protein [Croceitalea rosinachiae]|uniref:Uncharacterized protein n=1 Tax=Croceitalea rosinachiae TaxID=3075596 RepID=A0ABU3AD41_9FLAO|nr:hypothetical protein [Croceitalea sp. F388]MDT0607800.1 hypothetical protein [Croceitalea sp. F388]
MDCLELNSANDFTKWEEKYIKELHSLEFKDALGNMLLFEDDTIKLWNLKLNKGERMPFVRHNKDYSWISESDAILKSRWGNGRISLIRVSQGDTEFFENSEKNLINDLENLGNGPVVFKVLEYKQIYSIEKQFMLN